MSFSLKVFSLDYSKEVDFFVDEVQCKSFYNVLLPLLVYFVKNQMNSIVNITVKLPDKEQRNMCVYCDQTNLIENVMQKARK